MHVSIVTPSFRNSPWLKLCIASVADQQGVEFEHIVQDAGSDDGTLDWLPQDPRVKAFIEKDDGMYDAVNRGFRRAAGEVVAYLNCDEQFLPGALEAVYGHFLSHPELDVLFTDTVIVDAEGAFVCYRKSQVPFPNQLWFRMPVLTCAMFMRRSVFTERGIWFDTKWKDSGDIFWLMEVVKRKLRMGVLRQYTSIFTETGANRNIFNPNAIEERKTQQAMIPGWVRAAGPVFVTYHRLRSLLGGIASQEPFSYRLYTNESPAARVEQRVERPTHIWKRPT